MCDGYEVPMSITPGSIAGVDDAGRTNLGTVPSPTLSFTGERIVPGQVSEPLFRAHEERYVFAGKFVKDKAVLDVACGAGIGTHYLLTAGARCCTGLDIDDPSICYARAMYKGCEFSQCDATNLCVPDNSMDVVVSFETIEHLKDHLKFLSECNRVLKPGGVLICSTPNHTISRWARENIYHLHEFTVAEFTRALETIFVDVTLFGQKSTNQLVSAARGLLSRVLYRLHLLEITKRLLTREAPVYVRTKFLSTSADPDYVVQPYRGTPLTQPNYVIAVARARPGVSRGGSL